MMTDKDELSYKITLIDKEIERLEEMKNKPISRTTWEYTDRIVLNSDTGRLTNEGKAFQEVERSPQDFRDIQEGIENHIEELKERRRELRAELERLITKDPNYKKKKEAEEKAKQLEQMKVAQEKAIDDKFQERQDLIANEHLLIEYLRVAGMNDLANRLSTLLFLPTSKGLFGLKLNEYANKSIEYNSMLKEQNTGHKTTKREYKEIKKDIVRLSKNASALARKYKGLSDLLKAASKIVDDLKMKGIELSENNRVQISEYFNKPGGEYYQDDQFVQLKNIGYRYLKFYRDLDSEAKDDLARGRVR